MSTYQDRFNEALLLAERGMSNQSIKIFQEISSKQSLDYCSAVNLGVLYLQQAKIQQSKKYFLKAVAIDPYKYLAYYNLFILSCHQFENQKLKVKTDYLNLYLNQSTIVRARQTFKYLYLTLSCLYAELGQFQKDPKLCTKALIYCEENSVAYINRAILYQADGKYKLAQNDYSSAIYYAPTKSQFYMNRAQFYWKNNKIQQSNVDIKEYYEIKYKQSSSNSNKKNRQLKCKEISKQQVSLYETYLSERTLQLDGLLVRIRNLINSPAKQEWKIQIPASPRNSSIKQQEKAKNIEKDEIKQKEQSIQQKKQQDSAYIDQSSKNLSQQIQKLQKQIRLQKGKLSTSQSHSQSQSRQQQKEKQKQPSQQFTFLTAEIQKKSKQIQKIKRLQVISPRHSQSSATSRISDKIITLDQIANYKKIKLQIVSAQYFDSENKQQAKILLSYGQQKSQTQYSKTNLWRQKLQFNIEHNLHKSFNSGLDSSGEVEHQFQSDINEKVSKGQILVQLQMKSKSIWSTKKIIGKGTINIQQMGANKCIVSNGQQKTGIIYFKMKLQ